MAGKIHSEKFAMVPETVLYNPKVSATAMKLWCILQRHANAGDECYPGRERLGTLLGCTPRHVDRLLDELVEAKVLRIKYTKGQVNQYFLYPFGHTGPATLDTDVQGTLDRNVHRTRTNELERTARGDMDDQVPGPTPLQRQPWMDPPTSEPKADYEMNLTQVWKLKDQLKKKPTQESPIGTTTYFLDAGAAQRVGEQLIGAGRAGESGLVLPGSN